MEVRLDRYYKERGWEPYPFQREAWKAYRQGFSGLIHSPTGTGKTQAALGGFALKEPEAGRKVRLLWLTPLRALSHDTARSIEGFYRDLGLELTVELRTGDTTSAAKARQLKTPPDVLVTTPESLSLLLTRADGESFLNGLELVVCDEWHELMGTKRGVMTELCLARLRRWNPALRTWGLSATLANLQDSMAALLGVGAAKAKLITAEIDKQIVVEGLLPERVDRFPWAGHLGTVMVKPVCDLIEESESCLVFTNTRSQTELWFQAILRERPDWKGKVEIHHGSLEREVREAVEKGIKTGALRAVVCTSSLDLGVDFHPVDLVVQIGSPKGVARLLQRAGRSGHRPGQVSRVVCVPTHSMELADIAAARVGAKHRRVEARELSESPVDVLAQHLVTVALGEGFCEEEMKREVRTCRSFQNLTDEEWQAALHFVTSGGESLQAYPEFKRVQQEDGTFRVKDKRIALRHRTNIGTIVSDAAMQVKTPKGGYLGTVEESFVSRLKPGDAFLFGGKLLEFVRVKEMTCYVRQAKRKKAAVPRWQGGRMPLSNELALTLREVLDDASQGLLHEPEMQALRPLLAVQQDWSAVPTADSLLIERVKTREGHHLFFFPLEGRMVHEGLAALLAYRLSQQMPITFSLAANDYGFELMSRDPVPEELLDAQLFSSKDLFEQIRESLNAAEMTKRQFREIARIAGLIFQGYPGKTKSTRQIQASSGLFYDVFSKYDPDHILLKQAAREVLSRQLEVQRMRRCLDRLQHSRLTITEPPGPTPFAFPILVDRLRETVSSETIETRVQRLVDQLNKKAPVQTQ